MGWRDYLSSCSKDKEDKVDKEATRVCALSTLSSSSKDGGGWRSHRRALPAVTENNDALCNDIASNVAKKMKLEAFHTRALSCDSLKALEMVLVEFQQETWSLTVRAQMSAGYTPHARWLLGGRDNSARILEDLAALCWGRPGDSPVQKLLSDERNEVKK